MQLRSLFQYIDHETTFNWITEEAAEWPKLSSMPRLLLLPKERIQVHCRWQSRDTDKTRFCCNLIWTIRGCFLHLGLCLSLADLWVWFYFTAHCCLLWETPPQLQTNTFGKATTSVQRRVSTNRRVFCSIGLNAEWRSKLNWLDNSWAVEVRVISLHSSSIMSSQETSTGRGHCLCINSSACWASVGDRVAGDNVYR